MDGLSLVHSIARDAFDSLTWHIDAIDARGGTTTHDEVEAQTDNCLRGIQAFRS